MESANPYLIFDGTTQKAFEFYRSVFGGDFAMLVRFKDMGGGPPGATAEELERVAHVALPIGRNHMLMGSDTIGSMGQPLTPGNNVHIALAPESAEEAVRVFEGLSAGGEIEMPLQPTEWAEKYGSFADRFGVRWMVSYEGNVRFEPPQR